jgi:hypothetical protein
LPATLCPFRICYGGQVSRKIVVEDELVDLGSLCDASDLGDIGMKGCHPLEVGTGGSMSLEVLQIGNLVNKDICTMGKSDETVVHGGVA